MDFLYNIAFPFGEKGLLHRVVNGWDWTSLRDPLTFEWQAGVTPLSDLWVILISWMIYFIVVRGLQAYMLKRKPFSLRYITAAHNAVLCIGSGGMFVSALWSTYLRGAEFGMDEVFCSRDANAVKGLLFYTLYVYYLSKFYELLDTVILVLKKKPVIFLHGYHHAIVILMVWSWLEYGIVFAALGMIANTLIHVFMYYYYFATSLGYKVWFKRYLTSGQIVQFGMSFLLSIPYVYYHLQKGCHGFNAFLFSMAINGSFLVLFIQFYASTYGTSTKQKTT